MVQSSLARLAVTVLAGIAASCSVGLSVSRTKRVETVREPVPDSATTSLEADRAGDDLRIRIRREEQVRLDSYEVETIDRYRWTKMKGFDVFMDACNPVSYVWDLALALSAPFRADHDLAWGLFGGLAAVVVPGVSARSGGGEHWDSSTSRRLTRSGQESASSGLLTDLRIVTDREVLTVRTNRVGEVTIPLARLLGSPGRERTRVTVAHGDDVYAMTIHGDAITCTRVGAVDPK